MTSDIPIFHTYINHISDHFLAKITPPILANDVSHFVVVQHADNSADIYVNDFEMDAKIRAKGPIEKGQAVYDKDIADVILKEVFSK